MGSDAADARLRRVQVTGTSGSGKTTFAAALPRRLELQHVELDEIYWGPRWTPPDLDAFVSRARDLATEDAWAMDGSHRVALPVIWERAQLVVWLDYSLGTILRRIARRTARRLVFRERLWHGNRERFRRVFSRRSPIGWAIRTEHWCCGAS